jgi:hypothetical protein
MEQNASIAVKRKSAAMDAERAANKYKQVEYMRTSLERSLKE